jgi:putative PIN family toxin of toxin-antitoxin system
VIRAVLDTNLLVSYLLTHRPPIATLIDVFLAKDIFVMVTAPELLAEVDRVLTYPKLQRYYTDEERIRFVAFVLALSEVADLPESIPRTAPKVVGTFPRQPAHPRRPRTAIRRPG